MSSNQQTSNRQTTATHAQALPPSAAPNEASVQPSLDAMAQLASQVQASMGYDPQVTGAGGDPGALRYNFHPSTNAQPDPRNCSTNGNENNMQASFAAAAAYSIPTNWSRSQQPMPPLYASRNGDTQTYYGNHVQHQTGRGNGLLYQAAGVQPIMSGSNADIQTANTENGRNSNSTSSLASSVENEEEEGKGTSSKKAKQNRERNREHARSTRMRKKAYVEKLKDMAEGLRAVQTEEIRQRRLAVHMMTELQNTRKRTVGQFLHNYANYEEDLQAWEALIEDNFWLKQPVTPFRSFRRSEVETDCRITRGADGVVADAASIAVMIESVGSRNARWQRLKLRTFERYLERSGTHTSNVSSQRVESSLSSSSGEDDSSDESLTEVDHTPKAADMMDKLKRKMPPKKVSSSSGESNDDRLWKKSRHSNIHHEDNTLTSRKTELDRSLHGNAVETVGQVYNIDPAAVTQPALSGQSTFSRRTNLIQFEERDTESTLAHYAVNEDDMIMIDDVLMCPFVFRTQNAVYSGALADCVMPGMIRAKFSKGNKLQSMEMIYDAMGFMQQLDGANSGQVAALVIPGSLEMAFMASPNEARVITESKPPFAVVHVNETWSKMTQYTQLDAEGQGLLGLLEGEQTVHEMKVRPRKPKHTLEEVAKGRSACSTNLHYDKFGNHFVDFMRSYPLSNSEDEISHLLHVSLPLKDHVLI